MFHFNYFCVNYEGAYWIEKFFLMGTTILSFKLFREKNDKTKSFSIEISGM